MKTKTTIVMLLLQLFSLSLFAQVPLVYNVENRGSNCTPPPLPTLAQLPQINPLPDPFVFNAPGKGRSTSLADWACRRNEIKRQIENYEIGIKPPKPDTITANFTPTPNGGRLTVVVTRQGRSMTLTSNITLPAAGSGPFPAVIGMALAPGAGGSSGSLPADIFSSRNIASIEYVHNQVTTYAAGQDAPKVNDPFYILYPELIDNGQYSAWIWGISRLIDGIEIVQKSSMFVLPIDLKHLAVTGCSYAGKMALFAGAFDERIALTIAQESGGGGAPAWRVSHNIEPNGTVEKIDNTDDSWFMKSMRQFSGDNVYKLPHDHHELMAMIAPRALLVTGNTDFTWLSNRSTYVTSMATKEIYKTLGVGDRFGFYIDGQHGHCAIPNNQRPAIGAFVDKFLLGKTEVNTDTVMIRPNTPSFDTVDHRRWYDWWGSGNPVFGHKPVIAPSQSFTINNNVENGSAVGTIAASDVDANTTLQNWQIAGGTGAGFFSINAFTGELTVANKAALDFDNSKTYTLAITVSDGSFTSEAVTVIIQLTNVPVITPAQVFEINEWATDNYAVGTAQATDKDANSSLSNWKIVGGTGASLFEIDAATGEIKITNSTALNFNKTYSYTLILTVSDGVYNSAEETATITLSEKVNICHDGKTMYISRSKVPDHIKHGDNTGACATSAQRSFIPNTETEKSHAVSIYPNPVTNAININLGANVNKVTSIQLVDMSGKVLNHVKVNKESIIVIQRGSKTPGYYLLKLNGIKTINQKVVFQ